MIDRDPTLAPKLLALAKSAGLLSGRPETLESLETKPDPRESTEPLASGLAARSDWDDYVAWARRLDTDLTTRGMTGEMLDAEGIQTDISVLVERLKTRAARLDEEIWHSGARLLDAMYLALSPGGSYAALLNGPSRDRALAANRVLKQSADRINHAVRPEGLHRVPRWREDGPIAEALRREFAGSLEVLDTSVSTLRHKGPKEPSGVIEAFEDLKKRLALRLKGPIELHLARALEYQVRQLGAFRILPPEGTAEERIQRYSKTIARVRAQWPNLSPTEMAERIITQCAREYGVRRPSRFFGAENKRLKRQARTRALDGVRMPPRG